MQGGVASLARHRARHGAGADRRRRARSCRPPRPPAAQADQARPRRDRDRRARRARHRPVGPQGQGVSASRSTSCSAAPGARASRSMPRSAAMARATSTACCGPSRRGSRPSSRRRSRSAGTATRTRDRSRHRRRHRQGAGGAQAGGRRLPVGVRRQQPLLDRRARSGSGGRSRSSAIVWFEEPVQHYHVKAMGEVAQRLDITVSAGEQSYTLQSVAELIDAGVRMVQPDIVKMGGITGLMQCAALCHAHGVEFVPHQTQPAIGNAANLHVLVDRHARDQAGRAGRRLGARRRHLRQRAQARRRMPGRAGRRRGSALRSTRRCCRAGAST